MNRKNSYIQSKAQSKMAGYFVDGRPPNIGEAIEKFSEAYKDHPLFVNEMIFLHQKGMESYAESILIPHSEVIGEIYMREIFLTDDGKNSFPLRWSILKAQRIIQEQKRQKEFRPISIMNITYDELNESHFSVAIHNKKPGILISYEPWLPSPYFHLLIDGNHRIAAKAYKQTDDVHYPVVILNSKETFDALYHTSDQIFFLIHLLVTLSMNLNEDCSNFDELSSIYRIYKNLSPQLKNHGCL